MKSFGLSASMSLRAVDPVECGKERVKAAVHLDGFVGGAQTSAFTLEEHPSGSLFQACDRPTDCGLR